MNNDEEGEILDKGRYVWNEESNGTYTKTVSIYYRHGRMDTHILEEGISQKEYFRRKLDGTA